MNEKIESILKLINRTYKLYKRTGNEVTFEAYKEYAEQLRLLCNKEFNDEKTASEWIRFLKGRTDTDGDVYKKPSR